MPFVSNLRAPFFAKALAIGVIANLPFVSFAELPVARLFSIFPPGGKIGTNVEVEVAGQELDDLRALHFSNTNLTAKHLSGAKFSVSIPANATPGICDCRVVGRNGLSNPRSFAIGDLPEITAPTTNTSAANASTTAVNMAINGRAISEGVQFFKFAAKKGQQILVECQTESLDSRMVPAFTILNDSGHELAHSHSGGLAEVVPRADGEYSLKLNDFLFRGGNDYFYRLTLSTRPHIDFVLPASAVPGTKAKLALYGRNLPGGTPAKDCKIQGEQLEKVTVEVDVPAQSAAMTTSLDAPLKPAAAFVQGFDYRLSSSNGISNPIFISFASAAVALEQEPNDKPAQAQKITPPCEIAGQLYPANDHDWFTFEAKKGETFWIDVASQRLGNEADPFVLVQRVTKNDKGEEDISDVQEIYDSESLAGNELKTASFDPVARFNAKEDGTYRLEVRNQFRGVDPRNVYRLAIRKESPDFQLAVIPQFGASKKADAKDSNIPVPFLRRGQTIPLKIVALRRDGFKDDIDVSVEGLPAFISATHLRLSTSTTSKSDDKARPDPTLLFLTTSTNASNWVGTFKIVGRAKSNELERVARGTTLIWNSGDTSIEPLQIRFTRDFALAVSGDEPVPLMITAAEEKIFEASVGGKLQVPLRITRNGEFTAALKLKPFAAPALPGLKEVDVDGKATNATAQLEFPKAQPGEYEILFQTEASGKMKISDKQKDVTFNLYSAPIRLKITPASVAKK